MTIYKAYKWSRNVFAVLLANTFFKASLFILISAYLVVNIYFYTYSGLRIVGWHTHLVFPLILLLLGYLIIYLYCSLLGKSYKMHVDNLNYIIWIYTIVESIIMITGIAKVDGDDNKGYYSNYYDSRSARYYHNWLPGTKHELSNSEFSFERHSNSLGFPDREWDVKKSPGAFRILCLGDSFTEGDGAHADSTYPAFLQRILNEKYKNIEVLNAGTCGSDPYFNYINYKDRLMIYEPDLIIQTISQNDLVHDIPQRGGLERFKENMELEYTKPPWWEPFYAISYIFRVFISAMGYNSDLSRNDTIESNLDKYIGDVVKMIVENYKPIIKENQSQSLFLYLPMKSELLSESEQNVRQKMLGSFQKNKVDYKDLIPCYKDYIRSRKRPPQDFYWKYDGHHNALGYEMMASCVSAYIDSMVPDSLMVSQD